MKPSLKETLRQRVYNELKLQCCKKSGFRSRITLGDLVILNELLDKLKELQQCCLKKRRKNADAITKKHT